MPSSFVLDLPECLTMRGVVDRLGKLGFRHAFQIQRVAHNCVVLFDDRSGKLMSEIGAFIGDLLVLTSQCATGLGPVRAAFLAAGESSGGALDLAFGFPEESRVFGNAAIGVGGESIKTH